MTKLQRQIDASSVEAKQLMAELLWALLLFPSNIKPRTKRDQITTIWDMSGHQLPANHSMLTDMVLVGIGSGGPGFNNYRPYELQFLIELSQSLKGLSKVSVQEILTDYDKFLSWIDNVPRTGDRQYRHMLRYLFFPDRVERISSNNDRISILEGFYVIAPREAAKWTDRMLDDALYSLRERLQKESPSKIVDFYEEPYRAQWKKDESVIATSEGPVVVTIPVKDDESECQNAAPSNAESADPRQSFQIQAALVRMGIKFGFKIWLPRNDRGRVKELLPAEAEDSILENLPINHDATTLSTIEQIDVLWLKSSWIARAFEVEHTTAVYSGLLRMADLLALQPNMDIPLHIVAPEERKDKVFREMRRPVFTRMEPTPMWKRCTFISYDDIMAIEKSEHLEYMKHTIIEKYEEFAEAE